MTVGVSLADTRRVAEKMARYRQDYRAFVAEQLKIAGKPFQLWPCQTALVESVERQMREKGFARCVWLKSRQVGASTLAASFTSWRTMLWPHTSAIVIADEAERAQSLFEISRSFYDHLDEDIRPVGRYVTKRELVFANPSSATRGRDPGMQSRIKIDSAQKRNLAIGARWDSVHLSECARFPDPSFVIDGVIPAVHRVPGTIIILESSAEKSGTWFRDFCDSARRGENAFEFQFVPWILQPEYRVPLDPGEVLEYTADERHIIAEFGLLPEHVKWMRAKFAEMDNNWDLFRQSFPLSPDDAWVQPGVQVFPQRVLKRLRQQVKPPVRMAELMPGPRVVDAPQGHLCVWEEPQSGKQYDVGVDVAMGTGRDGEDDDLDFSVACVIERGSNKQVAEWASKAVNSFDLATILYWLGQYYNTAQIAVETNGIGGGTNQQLLKLGYPNSYIWRYRDEVAPRYSKKTGWETSPRSKPWLVGFMTHEAANDRVQVRSELLYKEMEMYVQKGPQEWGAVAGHHDDRVMAFGIALLTSDDENFERYYGLRKSVAGSADASVVSAAKKPEPWECDASFLKPARERERDPWD